MDKVLWGIVVPVCFIGLAIVYGACHLWIPETVPIQEGVFVPRMVPSCLPEPREDTQYVASIVVLTGILYAGSLAAYFAVRKASPQTFDRNWLQVLAVGVQLLLVAFVVAMVTYQDKHIYRYWDYKKCIIAGAVVTIIFIGWLMVRAKRKTAGTDKGGWRRRLMGMGCFLVALGFALAGLSSSIYRDGQPDMAFHFKYHVSYQMAEFAAVQNGSTPYVDFYPQYQSCISYLTLPIFSLVGLNLFSFTCVMVAFAAVTLLAYYYVFLRVTGGPLRALLLYLPFVGISLFPIIPNGYDPAPALHQMITPFTYFAVGPLRYFGPSMTLACLVFVLPRPSRSGFLALFGVASLSAINNLDFGVPALVAAVCASLIGLSEQPWPTFRLLRSVTGCLLVSGAAAVLAFVGITYGRTGCLPNFAALTMFQRVFAVNGFSALPMPPGGIHLVIMLTFMAAIAKGLYAAGLTPLRKGLLLYAGIFGSGAMMYYVVRSHPHVLVNLFLAWAFAFLLLTWICWEEWVGKIQLHGWRRAFQPLALLLTLGYLVPASSVAALPSVRQQWQRVAMQPTPGPSDCDQLTKEVAGLASPGEPIMVIHFDGHLACLHAGVRNLFPYASHGSLILYRQFDVMMKVLDERQIRYVIDADNQPVLPPLLRQHGYQVLRNADHWVIYCRTDKMDAPRESPRPASPEQGVE